MDKLAIFGAGGHGEVSVNVAINAGWSDIVLFDDDYMNKKNINGLVLKGNFNDLVKDISLYNAVFVAIGNNKTRRQKTNELEKSGANIISLIDKDSLLSTNIKIGKGSLVMPNSTINTGSILDKGVVINTGAVVEHNCNIKKYVHIAPNSTVCGNSSIGENSWIGAGSVIIENRVIGSNVYIGAGSVVIKNVLNHEKIVGNPARKI